MIVDYLKARALPSDIASQVHSTSLAKDFFVEKLINESDCDRNPLALVGGFRPDNSWVSLAVILV